MTSPTTFLRLLLFTAVLGIAAATRAQAVYDDAARTNYNGGWNNGQNSGTGLGAWNLLQNNNPGAGDYAGFYIGSSGIGAVDVTNKSFGIYANGANYNYAIAHRSFSNALSTGDVFSFKFKNSSIATGKVVGFSLFNGTSSPPTNNFTDLANAALFSFYFIGGNSTYFIWDSGGQFITSEPYHGDGMTLEFVRRPGNSYLLLIKSADGGTLYSIQGGDGYFLNGSGSIDSFACYVLDNDGGGDLHVNQFKVSATASVPPVIQNVLPANGSVYLPTSTNVTFDTYSLFSTIATNNIKLSLNGSNVTSMVFSGTATNWSVTASPTLLANQIYNAVIVVTDDFGNKTTNTFSFNTWAATNLFIEAEAYNYSGGGAILAPFTGQYDAQTGIPGSNGVDFLEFTDAGTNFYRTNDVIDLEVSGDALDHADYVGLGLTNWTLSYVQFGEWANYTRRLASGQAYNVYARMSGGGNSPVILAERTAAPFATTTNQPRAAIGTFVGFNTGNIVSNYAFVALKDFLSQPVAVRFAELTNTFRLTRIGDSYNLDYLIFVPITNTAVQRPYLSAGGPFPSQTGVAPDAPMSFTIANRQTAVVPASIQLFLNGTNVTGGIATSTHNAGTVVSYIPSPYYLIGQANTATVIYSDTGGVPQTNTWQFTVANLTVVPADYAVATASARGFNLNIAKAPNEAPGAQFPASSARAEAHLAGLITNTLTSLPWINEASPGTTQLQVINFDQVGFDGGSIPGDTLYPFVPASLTGSYTNDPNYMSLAASGFALLTPGIYKWGVRSDDGFRLTTGAQANPTNLVLGDYEGPRGAGGTSEFEFVITNAGYYPIRLLHYEGTGFASVEFYSVNRTTGEVILINNPTNAAAVQVFTASAAAPVTLLNPARTGTTTTFSFQTQAGRTHNVQYKDLLTDAVWQPLQTITGAGNITNITDSTAGPTRFYRVGTQ
jgi:hypothetical protein